MWWWVSTRYFTGLPRYFARMALRVQFDCQSETGESNTTTEFFIATTRLLGAAPPPCREPGARPPGGEVTAPPPIEARRLRVEIGADELAADDPLVRHVAVGGAGGPLAGSGGECHAGGAPHG